MPMKPTRVIAVISGKGGVGKSTIAANLGASLSSKFQKDVIIIDCNLSTSHLSLSLGMYYCPVTVNNVLRGENKIEEAMYQHPTGMKVMPASINLKDMEKIDFTDIDGMVRSLRGSVDFIILDTAPGLGRETYSAVKASDEAIIVATPNVPSVADALKCREILSQSDKRAIGLVVNMVCRKGYELPRKEIQEAVQLPVIASIPHDHNIGKSLANRKPVVMFRPNSKSSKSLTGLARIIATQNLTF